ncbi:MAG: Macrolide export ATP-binding/permease protein MacB [Myxococcaceae bacterium]|jgi:putative ABC transport system permease protein|nr:Macrolide export ATP-binding/permease protein MacB [Myxococcaceae bacterium]
MRSRFGLNTVWPLFGEALRAVVRHRGRSSLTALGIAIGIAAVVWVVALGRAGSERTEEELRKLGENLVWVEAGSRNVNGVRSGSHGTQTLTMDDAEAILRDVPLIRSVSPQVDGSFLVVNGDRNWTTRYRGVAPSYLSIKRWELARGNAFTDDDVGRAANVALIGRTVREQLFGEDDPVGQDVRVGVHIFTVVGVLAGKGQSADGRDQDDFVMVPYTTAEKKLRGGGFVWLDDITCSAVSQDAVNTAIRQTTSLLRQRHRIGDGQDDDFNIRRPEEVIKAQLEASRTFELLLISIASVALLVGGIGVMNVMLASVAERTSEIGLRLAVGAPQWAVQIQFLAEAVVLSLFGGLGGVAVSCGGSFALERVLAWPITIPVEAVLLAVAFSVGVGVFFGFYPAWRAARLDPIQALRGD